MSAPIPDAQPVTPGVDASAGFAPGPAAVDLCGFQLPLFRFALGLRLPSLGLPFPLPIPRFALALNCSLTNPIDVTAGVAWGGGRIGTVPRDPDADFG